jgi:hypothetical protein
VLLRAAQRALHGERTHGPKVAFLLWTLGFNAWVYLGAARWEPAYGGLAGEHQGFLLLTLLSTLYHDVQYHGLTVFVNRGRQGLGQRGGSYLLFCAVYAGLLLVPACAGGWYAGCGPLAPLGSLHRLAQDTVYGAVIWGLTLQHYVLDAGLWRVGRDRELRRELGLAA